MNITESQRDFIHSLISSRDLSPELEAEAQRMITYSLTSRSAASSMIDELKNLPQRAAAVSVVTEARQAKATTDPRLSW